MKRLALVALTFLVGACSSGTPQSTPPASTTPAATPPAASAPPPPAAPAAAKVVWMSPRDGETVKLSPKGDIHLMFSTENFQISPVPEGTVDKARPGVGHHHVGIDTDCLPPGTAIPKASPWVHFGKGDNMIDMQLTPGKHKLALEIGDDTHTTQPGLCSTITIEVVK
jgi:hypothetical protein